MSFPSGLQPEMRMDAESGSFDEFPRGYFDLLIMNYVLEHTINPRAFVSMASVPRYRWPCHRWGAKRLPLPRPAPGHPAGWVFIRAQRDTGLDCLDRTANPHVPGLAGEIPPSRDTSAIKQTSIP